MNLKSAITLAAKFTDPRRADQGFHLVQIEPGGVSATNGGHGIYVPTEEATVKIAVDASKAKAVIGRAGAAPKLTVKRNTLTVVTVEGSEFKQRGIGPKAVPPLPDPPEDGWVAVPADTVVAIAAIAVLAAEQDSPGFALSGLRLTPHWVATASNAMLSVVWSAGLVDKSITVNPSVFAGLTGDAEVVVEDRRLWVRSAGVVRWAIAHAMAWPDGTVNERLPLMRSTAGRVAFFAHGKDVLRMAREAETAADNPLSMSYLTLDTDLVLSLSDSSAVEYTGRAATELPPDYVAGDTPPKIGISAKLLGQACDAVGAVAGRQSFSIGTPHDALRIWGGSAPAIEMLVMPML